MERVWKLYHTGFEEIRKPDVHYGRINADFGQGFYMSDDVEFSVRWAREKRGADTFINAYELDITGLNILKLERNSEWYEYIYQNRHRRPDAHPEADVIVGPIANDTIFDTMGITTSGILSMEQSLPLLMIGPEYRQIVLKSERAAGQLTWKSARILLPEEIHQYRDAVAREEAAFMEAFATEMAKL